jgi:hypothetical protein
MGSKILKLEAYAVSLAIFYRTVQWAGEVRAL